MPKIGPGSPAELLQVPQFRCDQCNKFFGKLSRLRYHQNIHLKEKPYKCDYSGCTSAYYRPNHLKRHVEHTHRKPPKEFSCSKDGCGASFESSEALYFHTKRKHAALLGCSFCDKTFGKKWMVKEHEAGHTGENPFKCEAPECQESFKDFKLFRAHKRSHKRKEMREQKKKVKEEVRKMRKKREKLSLSLECHIDGCKRIYRHRRNLDNHIRTVHEGAKYACTICSRKLSSKQKLDHHMKVIHSQLTVHPGPNDKKSNSKILEKLGTMSETDWEPKRSGPSRYIRVKYDCVKFPLAETESDSNLSETITSVDSNTEIDATATTVN